MQPDRSHHTRHRVQLPSGKQIEVVYRDQQQTEAPAPAKPRLRIASASPIRCTSASTAPASWHIRWTGSRKARDTGGSSCAAPSARPAVRACSSRRSSKSLDEQLDRATGASAERSQGTHPGEHGGRGRVLHPRAGCGPDRPLRLLPVARDHRVGDQLQQRRAARPQTRRRARPWPRRPARAPALWPAPSAPVAMIRSQSSSAWRAALAKPRGRCQRARRRARVRGSTAA